MNNIKIYRKIYKNIETYVDLEDNVSMNDNVVALIIKEERKKHQLTQERLATLSGVNIATIRAIEQGTSSPNVQTLNKILNLFNLEIGVKKIER